MSALGDTLRVLADVLDAGEWRWFVFGAQAVAVRGAPRFTQDIDVTVAVNRSDLPPLMRALEAGGLTQRYPEIAEKLLSTGAVIPLAHPSGMEVDLVIAASGLETLAMARATRVSIDGVEVPVVHATDLLVMKILAGRGKDLDDARSILAGGEVDVDESRNLLGQLEQALGRSDLLPELIAALRDAAPG